MTTASLLCSTIHSYNIYVMYINSFIGAVKVKVSAEGLNPDMMDKGSDDMIPLDDDNQMVPACEHPQYSKFFKMLKVGLPLQIVKNKVIQESLDPKVMDKDPNDLIPLNDKIPGGKDSNNTGGDSSKQQQQQASKNIKKKKLHWKALDQSKVKDSLWADDIDGGQEDIFLDEDEFNALFVQPDSPTPDTKQVSKKKVEAKKQKVVLIDMKRAQNAGTL